MRTRVARVQIMKSMTAQTLATNHSIGHHPEFGPRPEGGEHEGAPAAQEQGHAHGGDVEHVDVLAQVVPGEFHRGVLDHVAGDELAEGPCDMEIVGLSALLHDADDDKLLEILDVR